MLSKEQSAALYKVHGFLNAFEYVNGKENHSYLFEIFATPKKPDLNEAVQEVFAKWKPSRINLESASDWPQLLQDRVDRWLLAYLKDSHHLIDRGRHFTLSSDSGPKKMVQHLIVKLEEISPINQAYTVGLEAADFRACAHDDILLVCDDVLLFLHFEVCD